MIVITGGAGMIGSMIAWHLNENLGRDDVVVVDRIEQADQWQNMCHRKLADYLDKDELFSWLERAGQIDAVIHMGAISATTERDFNRLLEANIRYSQNLWRWCADRGVPFLYASSAATYGGGEAGYSDDHDIDRLRPLNGYGFSKQFFDQWALRQQREGAPCPPRWYGFKYFNVYGPNEYHKGRMASVALHTYNQVSEHGYMKLFRSHRPDYEHGMQMRDFVYVKDVAMATSHFIDHAAESGLYNIGTGKARAFRDLSVAVMKNMEREPNIEFIDMPEDLRGKYQYFTEAGMDKLKQAGYSRPFMELEDGVADYVRNYLVHEDPYC
jgi:ADP-L-glycero-D-manno-heptose 6-epimerase